MDNSSLPSFSFPTLASPVSSRSNFGVSTTHLAPTNGYEVIHKFGRKNHPYSSQDAPWPLDYEHDYLHIESQEIVWNGSLGHPVTWLDFKDKPPKRLLDIGCGSGVWAVSAAQEWPDCEVVAMDMVDVQYPLKGIDGGNRVRWVYGNMYSLTAPLPFEDNSFDYVHMIYIARGVPEDKWVDLFSEIRRVLRPGGSIEIIEDDIIFPTLPKWFTRALRLPLSTPDPYEQDHDHALLEFLFYSIFERRFINLKPSATIHAYFASYFVNVSIPASRSFPYPPWKKISRPAIPRKAVPVVPPSYKLPVISNHLPRATGQLPSVASTSSQFSSFTAVSTAVDQDNTSYVSGKGLSDDFFAQTDGLMFLDDMLDEEESVEPLDPKIWTRAFSGFAASPLTALDRVDQERLYPTDDVDAVTEFSLPLNVLAIQLWRATRVVLSCREAMWDELQYWLHKNPRKLEHLGWTNLQSLSTEVPTDAQRPRNNRIQFEELIQLYESDIAIRMDLSSWMSELGLARPADDILSRSEFYRKERLYFALEEAHRLGLDVIKSDDQPCRVVRAMFGVKEITS